MKYSEEPTIGKDCELVNVELGMWTEVGEKNWLQNTVLGDWSYTGPMCIVQNADIGKFSNIAAMVRIGPTDHPMDRPTMHHFTYRCRAFGLSDVDDEEFFAKRVSQKTFIGHDTWLGHGVIIMPEVSIGIGAVIGSGALVTKDIGDYEVAVGIPAKTVKRRFPEDIAERLKATAWWDWDYETIKDRLDDFRLPVEEFLEKYG